MTIVVTRHSAVRFVSSIAGDVRYETCGLWCGQSCAPPGVDRAWFPLDASDRYRARAGAVKAKLGSLIARARVVS